MALAQIVRVILNLAQLPGILQVTSLAFTPDGQHLVSGDEEGGISAWDLRQAKRVHSSKAHSGPVWSLATSHGSGAILASGTTKRTLAPPFCNLPLYAVQMCFRDVVTSPASWLLMAGRKGQQSI